MSYTDLRDFDAELDYWYENYGRIQVEKLGGGSIGKAYEGIWRYKAFDTKGELITLGQDFETGTPKTHEQVASILFEMILEDEYVGEQ